AAIAEQRADFAVQGHGAGGGDRRSGTHLWCALDQREHIPGAGDLDDGDRAVPDSLLRHRDWASPGRAAVRDGPLMPWVELLHQIYVARRTLWGGLVTTLEISALVIALGTLAGLLVGLGLCYGHVVLRLALRLYVDVIRGVPSLVLIFFAF